MKKDTKEQKPWKAPKLFKKSYTEKKFQAKLMRHIAAPGDRKLLLSIFTQEENMYVPSMENQNKKSVTALAKSINKNKKRVRGGRVIFLAIILSLIIGGTFLFKNSLTETILEKGLSTVFQSDVEITGTRLAIFRESVSFSTLEVADSDNPGYNLFSISDGTLSIKLTQLLQSNFIAEEIIAQDLQWNTKQSTYRGPRTASPQVDTPEEEPKDPVELFKDPMIKVTEVYDEIQANLKTPLLLKEIESSYKVTIEDLQNEMTAVEKDFSALQGRIEEIQKWNKDYFIKNPKEIPGAISTIESIKNDTEALITRAGNLKTRTEVVYAKMLEDKKRTTDTIAADYAYLEENYNVMDFSVEEITLLLGDIFLEDTINQYLQMGNKAYKIVSKLTSSSQDKGKEKPTRTGRVVEVGREYPSVAIGKILVNTTGEKQSKSLEIQNISSNSTVWGASPSGEYMQQEGDAIQGFTFSTNQDGASEASVIATHIPVQPELGSLGIDDWKGLLDVDFDLNTTGNGVSGSVELHSYSMTIPEDTSPLLRVIWETISEEERILWTYKEEGETKQLTTTLDETLQKGVDPFLKELKKEGEVALKEKLNVDIASTTGEIEKVFTTIEEWKTKVDNVSQKIDEAKQLLEQKKEEIQSYIPGVNDIIPDSIKDSIPSLPGGGLGGLGKFGG